MSRSSRAKCFGINLCVTDRAARQFLRPRLVGARLRLQMLGEASALAGLATIIAIDSYNMYV